MKYYEEEIHFEIENQGEEKKLFDTDLPSSVSHPELLGIKIRLGNVPIVYNLEKLMSKIGAATSAEMQLHFEKQDVYLITHAIGVVRINGSAKVSELQYHAEAIQPVGSVTIDLLPKTRFINRFKIESGLTGAIKAAGNFSVEVPDELKQALSGTSLSLGGDMELELSTNSKFVGKLNYSIQLPIVQATGVSTNTCTWILKPDENPLLGDQLMIQTIGLPKGTSNLKMKIKGLVKVSGGWLSKTLEKETTTQIININL